MAGEAGSGDDLTLSPDDALRAALPGTLGRARVVITPYPFVAGGGDYLRVISLNSLAGVVVEIHGRQAGRGFEGTPFRFVHVPLSNRMPLSQDFPLNSGLVTNMSVFATTAQPLVGQTFVIIQLVRSLGSTAFVLGTLMQGYVTSTQGLGWPGSPIQSSIEGGGYVRQIVGTQPAAGADIAETVPAGARWELVSMRTHLATSATAGNRGANLLFLSGVTAQAYAVSPASIGPSFNAFFGYGQGQPVAVDFANQVFQAPLPIGNRLLAGMQIQTTTTGMKAGDQWDAPQFIVNEWLEAT